MKTEEKRFQKKKSLLLWHTSTIDSSTYIQVDNINGQCPCSTHP